MTSSFSCNVTALGYFLVFLRLSMAASMDLIFSSGNELNASNGKPNWSTFKAVGLFFPFLFLFLSKKRH